MRPPPKAKALGGVQAPPTTAEDGAKRILAQTIKLFDAQNGEGVDWRLVTESLFRTAFQTLEKLDPGVREKMALRVHAGAYERVLAVSGGDGGFSKPSPTCEPEAEISPQPVHKPTF